MYYEALYIERNDVANFMNAVKPQSAFRVEFDEEYSSWTFEFMEEADYINACKWIYTNYPAVYHNGGKVYFDTVSNSYAWEYKESLKTGFNSPAEADESFFDYLDSIKVA